MTKKKTARYPFKTRIPLPNLHAEGAGNKLAFRTKSEEAIVYLSSDSKIAKVVHRDLINGTQTVIPAKKAHHIVVGKKNWMRDVYHYLKPNPSAHLQLRLGVTVHRGEGTWSSLPHDFENSPERGFEEAFFYMIVGGPRRAFQVGRGLWSNGAKVDSAWAVEDRTFSAVPMGYHPVAAEPGCNVRYVWAYLAKKKRWEKI